MQWFIRARSPWVLVALAVVLAAPLPGWGQAKKPPPNSDEITFDTFDGVELRGSFFPAKKAKAPVVIFLHKYGESRGKQGWDALAQTLIDAEFAVLTFDFRGHGESTSVSPNFWKYSHNFSIKNGGPTKQKITYKDFPPGYIPVLTNDIAAAKRFVERQNDSGTCNASNVIVIGAEEGAAIGSLWIANEFERRPLVQNAFRNWVIDPRSKVAGEDIAGAVWLSMPAHLNNMAVSFWLTKNTQIRDKVPMAFFYGDRDAKAASAATSLVEAITKRGKNKLEFTRTKAKKTSLAGQELLGKKNLNTEEEIAAYLGKVMQSRGMKAWLQRLPAGGQEPPLQPVQLQSLGVVLR
jgi:pimeloyl-ACP methyl ester carboxylesterase